MANGAEIGKIAESAAGKKLLAEFEAWVTRAGERLSAEEATDLWRRVGTIRQMESQAKSEWTAFNRPRALYLIRAADAEKIRAILRYEASLLKETAERAASGIAPGRFVPGAPGTTTAPPPPVRPPSVQPSVIGEDAEKLLGQVAHLSNEALEELKVTLRNRARSFYEGGMPDAARAVEDRIRSVINPELQLRLLTRMPPPPRVVAPVLGITSAQLAEVKAGVAELLAAFKPGKSIVELAPRETPSPYILSNFMHATEGETQLLRYGSQTIKVIVKRPFSVPKFASGPWKYNVRAVLPGEPATIDPARMKRLEGKVYKPADVIGLSESGKDTWGYAATKEEAWAKVTEVLQAQAQAGAQALIRRPQVTFVRVGNKLISTGGQSERFAVLTKEASGTWTGEVKGKGASGEVIVEAVTPKGALRDHATAIRWGESILKK